MTKLVSCEYFLRITVVVVCVVLPLHEAQCGRECEWLPRQLYSAKNKVLQNSVYRSKTTPNHVICGRECHMDENCKSCNFYKDKVVCELNNASRAGKPEDFIDNYRSAYFDEDEATFLLSLPDRYGSCKKLLGAGFKVSGEYEIYPDEFTGGLRVYCDMETVGGGWIVFQRRQDGSVDFYRNWEEYKSTFGNLSGEFWLGNDSLVNLTSKGIWELRVDLMDGQTETRKWATYKRFKIGADLYRLYVGDYDAMNSTAGDSLSGDHNERAFSTKDADHDLSSNNCAVNNEGAWWYKICYDSTLNSKYLTSWVESGFKGIKWWAFNRGFGISLKETRMEIREFE